MGFQKISGEKTTWINITDATLHDVGLLRRFYPDLHPLHLEDILSPVERPKIDEDDDYLFVVVHFPVWRKTTRLSHASEVDFFIGRGYIITVHDNDLAPLSQMFREAQNDREKTVSILGKNSGHAFYMMLDKLVDYVFPILSRVDSNIRRIEEQIFEKEGDDLIRDIAVQRRDIIALRRIIRQQVPIVQHIERTKSPTIHEDLDEYFGDILDHLLHARDIIDEDAEIISGLSDTADTLFTHRINGVIRILTIFSVIMLPLTFLTSLYGMNIALPLQENQDSFLFLVILMIGVAAVMLTYFRYRRWL